MAGVSLDLIALQLFAGLALGAIYVLFAIGLSLIFGMLTVVNFAHGAFYMVGAYVGVYILMLGGDFWICLIVVPALWLFLEKTSFGLIIRAGARDPQIVRVLGVDVARVWLIVFGIGTAIAGFAGLLAAPLQGVIPEMGGTILAEAFVVTVVGGMGSIGGAVLAGLLVGVVVSMTSLFAPEMAKVSIFALMAVVLIIRPQGFFGRAGLMS